MTAALVPTSSDVPNFEEIVEAFLARDYTGISKFAENLIHEARPVQSLLLSLIGLCRSGNFRRAQQLAEISIKRLRPYDPWSAYLIELALGQQEIESSLAGDMNTTAQCQALFYNAAAKASCGEKLQAIELFKKAMLINAPCLELYLAHKECEFIEKADN
tara:strand:+ start:106439 stop:106918 length:480 start_codon:yes stop_codon:yes gene_type:complete